MLNINIIIIEAIIFAVIFTALVFLLAIKCRNTPAMIHNYPEDIQKEYFKTHKKVDTSYKSKKVLLAKSCWVLIFTAILFLCSYFAWATTFKKWFLVTFILMLWIGIYDTFFLDWIIFANVKMFKLEWTEHMDKAYHQKWFHLKGMLFPGLIFGLIPSVVVGLLIMLIN